MRSCFYVLLVCPVLSYIHAISFTRDRLLDNPKYTQLNISPVFAYSDVLLDIVVGGAAGLFRCFRMHRRGKRASVLVKLRERGFRTAMPSINLANLRSLPNKMDKLLLFSQTNEDFSNSAALCFTETLLNINERWCTDVTVLKKLFCSDCETFFINGKLFYSPWEIC